MSTPKELLAVLAAIAIGATVFSIPLVYLNARLDRDAAELETSGGILKN